MLSRVIIAAFCLGFVFAADEADARSAGHGAGRPAVAPRSLQRFQSAPAVKGTPQGLYVTRQHHRQQHHRQQHHRQSFHRGYRHRLPYVFSVPYIIGNDGMLVPTSFAETGSLPPGEQVMINRRLCFVQPHIVPEEGTGGMRTVTITRCY